MYRLYVSKFAREKLMAEMSEGHQNVRVELQRDTDKSPCIRINLRNW